MEVKVPRPGSSSFLIKLRQLSCAGEAASGFEGTNKRARGLVKATGHPFPPPPVLGRSLGAADGPFGCVLIRFGRADPCSRRRADRAIGRSYAIGCRSRGRALRPKNSAWLATAE